MSISQNRAGVVVACISGFAASLSTTSAQAQTLNWNNAGVGSASVAGNWNPAQVPTAANPLVFALNNVYSVTFNAATTASSTMTFVRGTVTLTMSAAHTTGAVNFGNANATNGIATLTTGTWNTGGITLGPVFGSAGTLNVNDDDALLDCSSLVVAGNTNQVCSVNVTGSGKITPSSMTIGGNNPIGTGHVTVSGQTQIFPSLRSTIDATGTITVGQDGIGTLTVSNGGLVATTGSMIVAENVSTGPIFSDGTVTVGGLGLILPATINVGTTMRIGRGTVASSDTGERHRHRR